MLRNDSTTGHFGEEGAAFNSEIRGSGAGARSACDSELLSDEVVVVTFTYDVVMDDISDIAGQGLENGLGQDEVAEAALFLATNECAKNCILNLDRGLSAI